MKNWIRAAGLAAALFAACGDDDGGESASNEVARVCMTQCERAEECGFFEEFDITRPECQSQCEKLNTQLTSDCMLTAAEANACRAAYDAQSCEQIENAEIPDACIKTCMTR